MNICSNKQLKNKYKDFKFNKNINLLGEKVV